MRRSTQVLPSSGPSLALAEWDALPPCVRVAQLLAGILLNVEAIRQELHTEQGSPLLWIEEPLDRLFADVDRALRRLAV